MPSRRERYLRSKSISCAASASGVSKAEVKRLKDRLIMVANKANADVMEALRKLNAPRDILTAVSGAIKALDDAADKIDSYASTLT